MTDAARVLLTAAVLAGTAIGAYAVHVARTDADSHARIVGQLRLASAVAVLLASTGAIYIGLAIANQLIAASSLDVAIGAGFIAIGAFTLSRAPREGLFIAACAFLAHALVDIGHRPGLLAEIAPRWYAIGCAAFDIYLAAVCYWSRRA